MTVVGEFAQIVHADFDQTGFAGAAEDAEIERPVEEFGENGHQVEAHAKSV